MLISAVAAAIVFTVVLICVCRYTQQARRTHSIIEVGSKKFYNKQIEIVVALQGFSEMAALNSISNRVTKQSDVYSSQDMLKVSTIRSHSVISNQLTVWLNHPTQQAETRAT